MTILYDMKHVLSALVGVVLIVALTLGSIFATSTPAPAAPVAQDTQGCLITLAGIKVCGTLLGQPLPEVVEVTLPPVTLPPVTVTDVVTIRPDPIRVTETIRPAPVRVTETVTAPPVPQPTVTETQVVEGPTSSANPEPQATVTETVRPNGEPVPTVTETVEVEVQQDTGQAPPESATIERSKPDEPFTRFDIDFGDEDVSAGEAGVGLLGALLILALVLAGMAYGFRRGVAVENREEAYFLRSILDRSKTS